MAEQLVAAAHGPQHAAILHVGGELGPLGQQVLAHDALLAVGPSANEHDVNVAKARAVVHVHLAHLALDAAPLEALPQHQDVAAVPVEVQQLGIEVRDGQLLLAHSLSPIPSSSAFAGHSAE